LNKPIAGRESESLLTLPSLFESDDDIVKDGKDGRPPLKRAAELTSIFIFLGSCLAVGDDARFLSSIIFEQKATIQQV